MRLILLGLIFSFNLSATAVVDDPTNCDHCAGKIRGVPEVSKDLNRVVTAVHTSITPEESLGNSICRSYNSAKTTEEIRSLLKQHVIDHKHGDGNPLSIVNYFINSFI